MRVALVLLAAAALTAGPAAAKPKKHARVPATVRAIAPVCQPMCAFDVTPCDPPEYKRTDGRCASPVVGGTHP